jgi:hypothetical protein
MLAPLQLFFVDEREHGLSRHTHHGDDEAASADRTCRYLADPPPTCLLRVMHFVFGRRSLRALTFACRVAQIGTSAALTVRARALR